MARFAEEGASLARVQLWLSVLGVVLVLGSLCFSGWAAVTASSAAKSAQKSADVSERALHGLERPYMFPIILGHNLGTKSLHTAFFTTVQFKNRGRIPAIPASLSIDFVHLTKLPDEIRHIPNYQLDPNEIIEPGNKTEWHNVMLGRKLDQEAIDDLKKGQSFIWLYGLLVYYSPTGGPYETEFMWMYNGLAHHFGPHDIKHNRMT